MGWGSGNGGAGGTGWGGVGEIGRCGVWWCFRSPPFAYVRDALKKNNQEGLRPLHQARYG